MHPVPTSRRADALVALAPLLLPDGTAPCAPTRQVPSAMGPLALPTGVAVCAQALRFEALGSGTAITRSHGLHSSAGRGRKASK